MVLQSVSTVFNTVIPSFNLNGRGNVSNDNVGNGVMRQILSEALKMCLDENICVTNSDNYVSLKVSSFVSSARLDIFFALGILCAMFLIKAETGPEPVSPALLQAAIGGFDSLKDLGWLSVVFPDTAQQLALLPESHDDTIIQNPEDRKILARLLECHMSTSVCFRLF
jgi:hypothetical protein